MKFQRKKRTEQWPIITELLLKIDKLEAIAIEIIKKGQS